MRISIPPSCMIHHTSIEFLAGSFSDGVADSYLRVHDILVCHRWRRFSQSAVATERRKVH